VVKYNTRTELQFQSEIIITLAEWGSCKDNITHRHEHTIITQTVMVNIDYNWLVLLYLLWL
jgi:hypothetical protein